MAKQQFSTNTNKGSSGAVRARCLEDVEKGDIVCVTSNRKGYFGVSLASPQTRKKSTGLLFVATHRCSAGFSGWFATFLTLPLTGDTKVGDPIFLKKGGKWGLNKTKTSQQIGIVLGGEDEHFALIAPQGRY